MDPSKFDRQLRAVPCDGYKYIWASNGQHESYNLAEDRQGLDNLIEAQPAKVEELRGKLDEWLASIRQADFEKMIPELDEVTRDRLEGRGYL
ncbi:MAG: hypothetical protein ACETWB_01060 [Anaerolineae bacterium]